MYIITEYVRNGNLAERINRKPLTMGEMRKYFQGLISALEYCHDYA
jgi:serine/threonine protein kinase